jgi:hypothetical protein
VGPPIPPEEIGIAAKVEKEKTLELEREKAKEAQPAPEQKPEEDLPDDVTQPLFIPR